MSVLRGLLKRLGLHREPKAAPDYENLDSWFSVREIEDAEPLVGELFRRRFHTDSFPGEPRHFVAFARQADGSELTLGYVHYTHWDGCELCGGLVVDDHNYPRLTAEAWQTLCQSGGIAEQLLRQSFAALPGSTQAIWGRIGHPKSEVVCRRVGFEKTDAEYIFVIWRDKRLNAEARQALIERVVGIGPF
jgi:hypothetical protein